MPDIALVTDSTSDLTREMREKYTVNVMPLWLAFGKEVILDSELKTVEFYLRLMSSPVHPTTRPATPEEFEELYRTLLAKNKEIISIHSSETLSQTVNSARTARDNLNANDRIHVLDSGTVSVGTAFQVAEAAKLIAAGEKTTAIISKVAAIAKETETIIILNTLEYLQKGGRIGRLAGMVGRALNLKLIVRISEDGGFESVNQTPNHDKALDKLVELVQQKAGGRTPEGIAVAHAFDHAAGSSLKRRLSSTFHCDNMTFVELGPIIGVHTGPGTLGVSVYFSS